MNKLPLHLLVIGLMAGTPALALDPLGQAIMNKRQVAGCMIKRMKADRLLSYIDARKSCLEELKAQNASLAASNIVTRGEHPAAGAVQPGS